MRYLLHRDSASQMAGAAALCAAQEGRFGEMHEYLLTDTTWMRFLNWKHVAEETRVRDLRAWNRCLSSEKTREGLAGDRAWGEKLRISVTPTLVTADGRLRVGTTSIREWMAESTR